MTHPDRGGDATRLLTSAVAHHEAGSIRNALRDYRRSLALAPSSSAAFRCLAHGLHLNELPVIAGLSAGRAIACDPSDSMAYALRGFAAIRSGQIQGARRWLKRAIALTPRYFEAINNLATAISQDEGPFGVSRWAARAVVLRGNSAEARLTYANSLLALGRWREAWPDHELRLLLQRSYPHALVRPRWTGEFVPKATLLVHDEIGYGDVFNYARYLPLARERVGELILELKPGLQRLFGNFPGVDRVHERGDAPLSKEKYDLHLPIESLPGLFQTRPDTVPPARPMPLPSAATVDHWRTVLGPSRRLRLGLVWAGSPGSGLDQARSCHLTDLRPLATVANVDWISLQKGSAAMQLAGRSFPADIRDIGADLSDFADTAAVLLQLDAIITVDTSVAHLAGVLGLPTLVLLSRWPAWRWLLDRSDSPWYDRVELFRQRTAGVWSDPVEAIVERLKNFRDRNMP